MIKIAALCAASSLLIGCVGQTLQITKYPDIPRDLVVIESGVGENVSMTYTVPFYVAVLAAYTAGLICGFFVCVLFSATDSEDA